MKKYHNNTQWVNSSAFSNPVQQFYLNSIDCYFNGNLTKMEQKLNKN